MSETLDFIKNLKSHCTHNGFVKDKTFKFNDVLYAKECVDMLQRVFEKNEDMELKLARIPFCYTVSNLKLDGRLDKFLEFAADLKDEWNDFVLSRKDGSAIDVFMEAAGTLTPKPVKYSNSVREAVAWVYDQWCNFGPCCYAIMTHTRNYSNSDNFNLVEMLSFLRKSRIRRYSARECASAMQVTCKDYGYIFFRELCYRSTSSGKDEVHVFSIDDSLEERIYPQKEKMYKLGYEAGSALVKSLAKQHEKK